MPVVIDLRPRMKVTIPWDKPAIAPVLDECRAIGNRGYRPMANWYEKHMRMCLQPSLGYFQSNVAEKLG